MKTRAIVIVAMTTGVLTLPRVAAGQVPAAWLGTWKLNLEKSTYNPGPPPYKRATYKIEPWKDGLKVTYDLVRQRGGINHLEWTGRLDGMDYPVQGVEEFVTNAYRPLGKGTYEVVVKVDGRVAATSKVTLSPDGRTMTTVTTGKDAQGTDLTTMTSYDRQ